MPWRWCAPWRESRATPPAERHARKDNGHPLTKGWPQTVKKTFRVVWRAEALQCNKNPATRAADSEALRSKVSLRCFPPGSSKGARGKQRKLLEKERRRRTFGHANRGGIESPLFALCDKKGYGNRSARTLWPSLTTRRPLSFAQYVSAFSSAKMASTRSSAGSSSLS